MALVTTAPAPRSAVQGLVGVGAAGRDRVGGPHATVSLASPRRCVARPGADPSQRRVRRPMSSHPQPGLLRGRRPALPSEPPLDLVARLLGAVCQFGATGHLTPSRELSSPGAKGPHTISRLPEGRETKGSHVDSRLYSRGHCGRLLSYLDLLWWWQKSGSAAMSSLPDLVDLLAVHPMRFPA